MSKHDGLVERLGRTYSTPLNPGFEHRNPDGPEAIAAIRELEARVEALELAAEPLSVLAGDPAVNMSDPLSRWFTIAQFYVARDAIRPTRDRD